MMAGGKEVSAEGEYEEEGEDEPVLWFQWRTFMTPKYHSSRISHGKPKSFHTTDLHS